MFEVQPIKVRALPYILDHYFRTEQWLQACGYTRHGNYMWTGKYDDYYPVHNARSLQGKKPVSAWIRGEVVDAILRENPEYIVVFKVGEFLQARVVSKLLVDKTCIALKYERNLAGYINDSKIVAPKKMTVRDVVSAIKG